MEALLSSCPQSTLCIPQCTLASTEVEQLAVFCYFKKCILVTN